MSDFEQAQQEVHTLDKKPAPADLLVLYAHFKQATAGDVSGERPGMLNVTGRLKYDAWADLKGMSPAAAEAAYIAKVKALKQAEKK